MATVDQNGKVTFLKTGNVTITATAMDGSKKSGKVTLKVISDVQPGSLKITGWKTKDAKKVVGKYIWTFYDAHVTFKTSFTQSVPPTNKKVVWQSSNPNALIVTNGGVAYPNISWIVNRGGFTGEVKAIACPKDHVYDPVTGENEIYCASYSFFYNYTDIKSSAPSLKSDDAETMSLISDGIPVYGTITLDSFFTDAPMDVTEETKDILADLQPEGKPEAVDPAAVSTEDPSGSPELEAGTTAPHFASNETWMTVGESLILDVLDADGEAVIVGLDGDTDAVLWNEELRMLTAVGEAEVTAFISTIDPVEIKDMMAIHIISEILEEEEVSEETGDAEDAVTEENSDQWSEESDQSDEAYVSGDPSELVEPVDGEENIGTGPAEGDVTAEVTEPEENEENAEDAEPVDGEAAPEAVETGLDETDEIAEETPAAEPVEIVIRDLGEYDALSGEAEGAVVIGRERFELDNETLSGLVFEIENEFVAKLTAQSVEEMLVNGIEIQLLAEGDTKLLIKQNGEAEPLREIRLVVTAAPVVEKAEPAEEVQSEPELLYDGGNDSAEDQNLLEFNEEFLPDEINS